MEKSSAKFIVKEVKYLLSICSLCYLLVSSLLVFLCVLCSIFVMLLDKLSNKTKNLLAKFHRLKAIAVAIKQLALLMANKLADFILK